MCRGALKDEAWKLPSYMVGYLLVPSYSRRANSMIPMTSVKCLWPLMLLEWDSICKLIACDVCKTTSVPTAQCPDAHRRKTSSESNVASQNSSVLLCMSMVVEPFSMAHKASTRLRSYLIHGCDDSDATRCFTRHPGGAQKRKVVKNCASDERFS